jgi:hypothetical protein
MDRLRSPLATGTTDPFARIERMSPTKVTIKLDLAALPPEGVESFVGGATRVEHGGKKWAGFVKDARVDGDEIVLTVQAVTADEWEPS